MTARDAAPPSFVVEAAWPEDFAPMAELVVSQCQDPARHCLHSWTRGDAAVVVADMKRLARIDELVAWKAVSDGELLGVIAAEVDRGDRSAWIRGPFVAQDSAWASVADALFAALEGELSGYRRCLVALNGRNQRAERFYARRGFGQRRAMAVYRATAAPPGPVAQVHGVELLVPARHASFARLHDAVFPGAYHDGAALAALTDADHRALVVCDGQRVVGYVYGSIADGAGEIEFIGVAPDQRRRGIARALMVCLLGWLFGTRGATFAELNLAQTHRQAAAPLYEGLGFALAYTGVGLRRGS